MSEFGHQVMTWKWVSRRVTEERYDQRVSGLGVVGDMCEYWHRRSAGARIATISRLGRVYRETMSHWTNIRV